jgi:hypothetical protein
MISLTRAVAVSFALLLLAGCAYGPTPEQLQAANYGTEPDQEFVEQEAKDMFEGYLKDPESARYQFAPVYRGWIFTDRFEGSKLYTGYVLDVNVNAKNSYGGYTGYSLYRLVFQNGRIIRAVSVSPQGMLRTIR